MFRGLNSVLPVFFPPNSPSFRLLRAFVPGGVWRSGENDGFLAVKEPSFPFPSLISCVVSVIILQFQPFLFYFLFTSPTVVRWAFPV